MQQYSSSLTLLYNSMRQLIAYYIQAHWFHARAKAFICLSFSSTTSQGILSTNMNIKLRQISLSQCFFSPLFKVLPAVFLAYKSWSKKDSTFWDKSSKLWIHLHGQRRSLISVTREFQRSDSTILNILLSNSICCSPVFSSMSALS